MFRSLSRYPGQSCNLKDVPLTRVRLVHIWIHLGFLSSLKNQYLPVQSSCTWFSRKRGLSSKVAIPADCSRETRTKLKPKQIPGNPAPESSIPKTQLATPSSGHLFLVVSGRQDGMHVFIRSIISVRLLEML